MCCSTATKRDSQIQPSRHLSPIPYRCAANTDQPQRHHPQFATVRDLLLRCPPATMRTDSCCVFLVPRRISSVPLFFFEPSNIVRRRPIDNRPPTPEEMEFYLPFLLEEIDLVSPTFIVTLGNSSRCSLLLVVTLSSASVVTLGVSCLGWVIIVDQCWCFRVDIPFALAVSFDPTHLEIDPTRARNGFNDSATRISHVRYFAAARPFAIPICLVLQLNLIVDSAAAPLLIMFETVGSLCTSSDPTGDIALRGLLMAWASV